MSTDVPSSGVGDWLAARTAGEPPPIFGVVRNNGESSRGGRLGSEVEALLRDELGARTSVVQESGAVRFSVAIDRPEGEIREAGGRVSDGLMKACFVADDREYRSVDLDPEVSGTVMAAVRSYFPGTELAALGPGGGAMAFASRRGVTGELVVRRRAGIVAGGVWRSPEEILADLRVAAPAGANLAADLGYFEAGSTTVQEVIRPAFLFVLDQPQPESTGAGWRRAFVIPATTDSDLPLSLGLESWWESE